MNQEHINKLIDAIACQSYASGVLVDIIESVRHKQNGEKANWDYLDAGNRAAATWLVSLRFDGSDFNTVLATIDHIMSESGENARRKKWGDNFRST